MSSGETCEQEALGDMTDMRTITLTVGAGAGRDIPLTRLEGEKGTPREILTRIAEEELHDGELRRVLAEPRLALDVYAETPEGEKQQHVLSPDYEDWGAVFERLRAAGKAELNVQVSHAGGASADSGRVFDNPAQTYPAGYELTAEDRAAVGCGRKLFIRGWVIAAVEEIVEACGSREAFWYYTAPTGDASSSAVIADVHIPVQRASMGYVSVEPRDVAAAGREARRAGGRIVGLGHSHGKGRAVFSSPTDLSTLRDLPVEGLSLTAGWQDGEEGDRRQGEFMATTFSTSNERRHLFPIQHTELCPQCRAIVRSTTREAGEVTVGVIGEVSMSEAEREAVRAEVSDKVHPYAWSASSASYWSSTVAGPEALSLSERHDLLARDGRATGGTVLVVDAGEVVAAIPKRAFENLVSNGQLGEWVKR